MKLLITGFMGQLGQTLNELLQSNNNPIGVLPQCYQDAEIVGVDLAELDISDAQATEALVKEQRPDIIFNCAAMTNVDGCETDYETAVKANVTGVANLAKAAQSVGAKFLHVSTDYVFAGDADTPYCEQDLPAPNTAYGKSKYAGEQMALSLCQKTYVVRTAWLYSKYGNNFVKTMRRLGAQKEQISVVCDQRGNPTNALDLAYHMLLIAATENYGIYHCTGNDECSWCDFAKEIMRLSGLDCRVNPCTSEEYPSKTPRPKYSSLRNLHLESTVGDFMRPWKEALAATIRELDAQA